MSAPRARWLGLPLSVQIVALLVGGLVVAQLSTLALTLLLPPQPPPQHSLAEIAQALRGGRIADGGARPLVRTVETAPPSLQSPGWLVSERSTRELAALLAVPEADVRLLFYAPPPLAGAGIPPQRASLQSGRFAMASLALFDPGGGGPGHGGAMPSGPVPGGTPSGGDFPGGTADFPERGAYPAPTMRTRPATTERLERPAGIRPAPSASGRVETRRPGMGEVRGPAMDPGRGPGGMMTGGPGGERGPPPGPRTPPRSPLEAAVFAPLPPPDFGPARRVEAPPPPAPTPAPAPAIQAPAPRPELQRAVPVAPGALSTAPAGPVAVEANPTPRAAPVPVERPLAAPVSRGLFGLAPAPYVEGEFVAAVKTGPDQWVTVKPKPEAFPNGWQRRVLLWFALSFAVIAPLGYLFARRLAEPLRRFADAAERLGRDPSAEVAALDGPAEVGRAARAFNVMQGRMKRYVDDRTGMIGAISHDLRTPLARMRFRLERAPEPLRIAMDRDIAQMDEMISSVLAFMRDDAAGGARERVDLRSILEVVVDDADAGGAPIELEPGAPVAVEVDVVAVQRVFENLVENALKYGERASLRLYVEGDEAVAEVADTGPGLPDEELERAFAPFYRGAAARTSGKGGVGLGLAVSRSTVRAHGGDLTLCRASQGLIARVRLPLSQTTSLPDQKAAA